MPAGHLYVLSGMSEFRRALAKADAQAADDVKSVLFDVARPMAAHATGLSIQNIRRMTIPWSENRIGVTFKSVYIVPKRRSKRIPGRRRPNFATLIAERAYDPTAAHFAPTIEASLEHALGRIVHTIEHSF